MANPQTDTHAREQTKRDEQAHKNGEAARAGVEKLADFRQRATEDAWKSMESSVDAASQGFQNASDQFARTLGYSGEEGERLARQSGQDVEAITKFGDRAGPSLSGHLTRVVRLGSEAAPAQP